MLTVAQNKDIRKHFEVPAYIQACSSAIYYDLMHGPSWCLIPEKDITKFNADCYATYRNDLEDEFKEGDVLEETYTGLVAAALRGYIDGLPSVIWYDQQSGEVLDTEPEGYKDEDTDEWVEPEWSDYYRLEGRDIVKVLFGDTIAREFK